MSQHDLGILLGIAVISISIICGVTLVFASMRSSQIRTEEKEKEKVDE